MKSLLIAFAMYSKVPMPRVDWEKRALSWAMCFFPLVGAVIGAVLYGWMALVHFAFFADHPLPRTSWTFWFMMQIAMGWGFAFSYPVNAWLIRHGIKKGM